MKRLLLFSALVAASVLNVFAYDFSAVAPSGQTLYYKIRGSNATVTSQIVSTPFYATYPAGALAIPSTVTYNGNTYSVTSIDQTAFYGCTGLTSVTIPRTITSIGVNAFYNCSGLTSVTFNADSCTMTGSIFYGDTNITNFTFGNSVRYIPTMLCYELTGLTSVTIPNSVISIGQYAFYGCSGLTSITIPNSVTSIGGAAFHGCSGLTSVTIPNSVTSIGVAAFYGCSGLTSVTIPNSVTSIAVSTFYYCSSLPSITIPSTVTSIGGMAFQGCTQLDSIVCKGSTPPTLGAYSVPTTTIITIPCGTTSAYTASWGNQYTFLEAFLYELNIATSDSTQGTVSVQQQPSCSDSVAILIATPATSYRFEHWSDGSTDNPYTLAVTCDTTLVAYFANVGGGTDGISDIKNNDVSVYVAEGRIHVTLNGQTTDEFSVYDVMGRRAAHVIASDKSPVLPAGVYIVKFGTLPARKVVVIR
jgi:hypothetical protein